VGQVAANNAAGPYNKRNFIHYETESGPLLTSGLPSISEPT
jgi:hypothetical protein